jgi:sec-independent protein translocase protein TatA
MNFGDLFDSPWKILIVAVVIIVLFGSRKLPAAARSLGQSMRILKTEVQGLHEDGATSAASSTSAAQSAPAQLEQTPSVTAAQAQIDALSQQIASLQQTVAASNVPASNVPANNVTDSAQAK